MWSTPYAHLLLASSVLIPVAFSAQMQFRIFGEYDYGPWMELDPEDSQCHKIPMEFYDEVENVAIETPPSDPRVPSIAFYASETSCASSIPIFIVYPFQNMGVRQEYEALDAIEEILMLSAEYIESDSPIQASFWKVVAPGSAEDDILQILKSDPTVPEQYRLSEGRLPYYRPKASKWVRGSHASEFIHLEDD
ncbi:hypothetical protein ABW20_dc0100019 [Dactylellina cionopaga]|nr:hypothetical protein ABW20_dc0100019 [Dactylellina cionopaga]